MAGQGRRKSYYQAKERRKGYNQVAHTHLQIPSAKRSWDFIHNTPINGMNRNQRECVLPCCEKQVQVSVQHQAVVSQTHQQCPASWTAGFHSAAY